MYRALLHAFVLAAVVARGQDTPIILRDLAVPRYFGTAANTSYLFNDKAYTEVASTQFSMFTPENELKWETVEPQPGVFNFAPADEIVKFSQSVKGVMHGHTFMWASQLAPWVNDTLTAAQLDAALKNHITTIMERYKGQFYAYDVINEMISDQAPNSTFKSNIWTQKFGENALPMALRYARAADPSAKLYINEYSIEAINNKSNTLYNLVKTYIRDGVPIDGVGFQSHFYLGQVPPTFKENLQRFADLGLEVAITEMDINMRGPANETNLAQQAKDFYQIVAACVAVSRCVSIAVWGISDGHSWIQPPNGNVLPWDSQYKAKPAFYAIADALQGKPLSVP